MESSSSMSSIRIEKLGKDNYYAWKLRVRHVLALNSMKTIIHEDSPQEESELIVWKRKDEKAQAIIGLSLSDELLENVREIESAKEMWTAIQDIFEKHTLVNKLSARRKFYTAEKQESESMLQFSNRIRQLASTLKSMQVYIPECEMAMTLLNGLPDEYSKIITALDAVDTSESDLSWDHIKARILKEEQRIKTRHELAVNKSEAAALVSTQVSQGKNQERQCCSYCGRAEHSESSCWKKFPNLAPNHIRKHILKAQAQAQGTGQSSTYRQWR